MNALVILVKVFLTLTLSFWVIWQINVLFANTGPKSSKLHGESHTLIVVTLLETGP